MNAFVTVLMVLFATLLVSLLGWWVYLFSNGLLAVLVGGLVIASAFIGNPRLKQSPRRRLR